MILFVIQLQPLCKTGHIIHVWTCCGGFRPLGYAEIVPFIIILCFQHIPVHISSSDRACWPVCSCGMHGVWPPCRLHPAALLCPKSAPSSTQYIISFRETLSMIFYSIYPRRRATFSEHSLGSFVQYLTKGHADSGMPAYFAFIDAISSSETFANGRFSK